ncbi:MAG: SUMF1/EgtB/PvdO family nonheme iron enzyme [Planctomycetota bacterium]|jgi:formylglycine-generating enzyme required for sulfatase activity
MAVKWPCSRSLRGTLPAAALLTVAVVVLASLPSIVLSQERPRASGVAGLVRQLDHDDYRQRDAACDDLIALVRKQPDSAKKRRTAIDLAKRIREYFFTKYEKLPEVMVEEESDHGEWITDSFERVHANRMPEGVTDYVEIAFEDVLCRIRGLRLEALYGREEGMVAVDAGRFLAGSTETEVAEVVKRLGDGAAEHPVRCVWSERLYVRMREVRYPFYISRDLVSVEEFSAFLKATGSPVRNDPLVRMNKVPGNPVCLGIDTRLALEYVNWSGKRFPSEDEWEKAARGMYGRRYAQGNHTDLDMHLGKEEGGVGDWPFFDDFEPLGSRPLKESKRRFFTGPFGARTLGLFPEATVGFNLRHSFEPPKTFPAEDLETPSHARFPYRRDHAYRGANVSPSKWRVSHCVLKGGTTGLASTDEFYPRVASRGFVGSYDPESRHDRHVEFFRCALDIPQYGRKLHKEVEIRVHPPAEVDEEWQRTGLRVKKWDGLSFRARGTVTEKDRKPVGPLGRLRVPPRIRPCRIDDELALVGRVGPSVTWDTFHIGASMDTLASDDGELLLKINRCGDKELSGEFVVTVRVYRK